MEYSLVLFPAIWFSAMQPFILMKVCAGKETSFDLLDRPTLY
jgi:hypothetical protein